MTPELVLRPFIWNERRYERVWNKPLALQLLWEEWHEWLEAREDVDLLDAMMDVQFVALGAIWKLNMTRHEMETAQEAALPVALGVLNVPGLQPGFAIASFITDIDVLVNDVVTNLFVIQFLCEAQCKFMGMSAEQVDKAFEIVCDANDSKTIAKTDPSVKANVNKGEFFVGPEARLQGVLNERLN